MLIERARHGPPRGGGVLLTFALAAATFVGVAIGAPQAPAITLSVQPKVAPAGLSIQMSGSIVVRQRGERVRIEENPCGRGWRYLKTVETDEHGAWTGTPASPSATDFVIPSMRTAYRATWRGARSSPATVAVRPYVRLWFDGRGRRAVEARIFAHASLWGHKVTFQRLVEGRWRALKQVKLGERHTTQGPMFVASFRHGLPRGASIRAALTLAEARPCYVGGFSNVLTL
jgi:hypothetical protein